MEGGSNKTPSILPVTWKVNILYLARPSSSNLGCWIKGPQKGTEAKESPKVRSANTRVMSAEASSSAIAMEWADIGDNVEINSKFVGRGVPMLDITKWTLLWQGAMTSSPRMLRR